MKHKHRKLFFSPEKNYFKADGEGIGLCGPPGSATEHSTLLRASMDLFNMMLNALFHPTSLTWTACFARSWSSGLAVLTAAEGRIVAAGYLPIYSQNSGDSIATIAIVVNR